jgi:O-antigen ligase
VVFPWIALAVFMAAWWWTQFGMLVFAAIMAVGAAIIIQAKGLQTRAFALLAAVLPWSVKVPLGPMDIMLPGEWGVGVLALVVVFEALKTDVKNWPIMSLLPAIWIATFLVPTGLSTMLSVSVKFTLVNALYVLVFFYGTQLFGRNQIRLWLRNYFVSFSAVVLWGLYQFYLYDFNPITITGIFQPFYYSSTYVGAVAALFAGYFLGLSASNRKYVVAVLLSSLIVVFTESRAALLSLAVVFFTFGLVQLPRKFRLLLPTILVAIVLTSVGTEKIEQAFEYNRVQSHDPDANVFEETLSVTNVQTDVSNVERLNRWVSALKMFSIKPHIGFGPGTYQFQYIPFQDPGLKNRLSVRNPDDVPKGSGGSAHSELFLQLSENGWPSLLVFLVLIVLLIRQGLWSTGQRLKNYAPYFLGLTTYMFHMNVNNFLNQPAFAFLFWTFGAMLMTTSHE